MATPLRPIECSAQPLCFSFHPQKDIVAAGLVDGTLEVHDLVAKKQAKLSGGRDDVSSDEDENDDDDQHMDSDNDVNSEDDYDTYYRQFM